MPTAPVPPRLQPFIVACVEASLSPDPRVFSRMILEGCLVLADVPLDDILAAQALMSEQANRRHAAKSSECGASLLRLEGYFAAWQLFRLAAGHP